MSSTIFDGVIANFVIQNMHYEKLNLLSKLISKFYIQSHTKVGISYTFRYIRVYKILYADREHIYVWVPKN